MQALVSIVTLIGVIATAVLAHLAKRNTTKTRDIVADTHQSVEQATQEVGEIHAAVNGQRTALEMKIAALELKLEAAITQATALAKEQADNATLLAKTVSQAAVDVLSDKVIQIRGVESARGLAGDQRSPPHEPR